MQVKYNCYQYIEKVMDEGSNTSVALNVETGEAAKAGSGRHTVCLAEGIDRHAYAFDSDVVPCLADNASGQAECQTMRIYGS
jgi:hypothetical protein